MEDDKYAKTLQKNRQTGNVGLCRIYILRLLILNKYQHH